MREVMQVDPKTLETQEGDETYYKRIILHPRSANEGMSIDLMRFLG
jgi:hypothetical protein